jgi:ABC-2 type transport system permease protein
MTARPYLRLLSIQLRTSLALAMQYRVDFALDALVEIVWAVSALIPLFVVYGARDAVAGWTFPEALLVVGWFTLLQGVIEGAINPSLLGIVEHVRRGTLDFVLLKPKDAQFLVSTSRFSPWKCANVVTALVIVGFGLSRIERTPSVVDVISALTLLACALAILYSITILTVSASFYVVRIDNLTYLFSSVFDVARWPNSVFRGAVRFVFTFVLPFALMTTYPAQALLGRLPTRVVALSVLGALAFVVGSRLVFLRALKEYTSASS